MIRIALLTTVALIAHPCVVNAHNLFVLVQRQSDQPDLMDVIFEHAPFPGDGQHNGPLIKRGQTWVRTLDQKDPIPHTLSEISRRGKSFLQGETNTATPRVIEHSCLWGIYHGQLDYFRGKYLDVKTANQASPLGTVPDFPFDMVPRLENGALRVQALWKGEPRGTVTVHVWPPGGREKKVRADERGIVTIAKPAQGIYSFSAVVRFPEEKGQFEDQPYQGVMHGVTLSMPWPLK